MPHKILSSDPECGGAGGGGQRSGWNDTEQPFRTI